MAKNRLSKLQKWILKKAIDNMLKRCEKEKAEAGTPYLYREEIYREYYKYAGYPRDVPQKFRVSVSRSLKRLEELGFIRVLSQRGCFILYTKEYCKFIMSEYQKKKALNVNEVS